MSVDDAPALMVLGDAVNVQLGGGTTAFTVTVALAAAPLPAALLPTTLYVVVAAGDTLPLDVADEKPALVQVYDVAAGVQLAVRVEDPPALMVPGEAVSAQTGVGSNQNAVMFDDHVQLMGK